MPEFKMIHVEEIPYFYKLETCSMSPQDIGDAMRQTFQSVWDFLQSNGLTTTGKALAVYHTYDPEQLTFRAGFSVAPDVAHKAEDPIRFDKTPQGQVLYFQHKGPYSKLTESYSQMTAYMEKEGLKIGAPSWEVYVNDPTLTAEEDLLTDVFVTLA